MGIEINKWLYIGTVYHKRFEPKVYSLKHKVYFIKFPLSRVTELSTRLFSIDRWNLFSFYQKDHGNRKGGDLWQWAVEVLRADGILDTITEIELQTTPRVLGFVFNPVSFWDCYSGQDRVAIIAEVNNTFGESQAYVLNPSRMSQDKVFTVSPFFEVTGQYQFKFSKPEDPVNVRIDYLVENRLKLTATIGGSALKWSDYNLFLTWLMNPLMTFTVVFYIHFHALILFIKRVPFYGKQARRRA